MLNELIAVTKPVVIDHPIVIHDDRVVQTPTTGEPGFLKCLHILKKSKCSCTTDLFSKGNLRKINRCLLRRGLHGRMVKVDAETHFESVERLKACPLVPVFYFDRFTDADELLGR